MVCNSLPPNNSIVRYLLDQQLAGPSEDYTLNALVFAIDKATNESVHITRLIHSTALSRFRVIRRRQEAHTYDTGNGTTTVDVESRASVLTISRSDLARAFKMCLLLVNWVLTAGIL